MPEQNDFIEAVQAGDVAAVSKRLATEPLLANLHTGQGLPVVLLAMYYGQPAIANLLISRGAVLDIFTAAATGQLAAVQQLVSGDATLANAFARDGFQPLGLAAFFGQVAVARFLLAQGAAVNSPSQNDQHVMPLHSAVAGQYTEIARDLLATGAGVNARQAGGFTPLHAAADNGQLEMVQLLLSYGADTSATTSDGKTARDFALAKGHLLIADKL